MTGECEPLPIWRPGEDRTTESSCTKDALSREIWNQDAPATAKITHGFVAGSGFFIGDGSEVATNAHVVDGEYGLIDIETLDHTKLKARIEALDDINDVAILRLENGRRWNSVIPLGSSEALKRGDLLFGLGHPEGSEKTYISPGKFVEKGPFNVVFGTKDPTDTDWQRYLKLAKGDDTVAAEDIKEVMQHPRVEAELHQTHGNSGGAMVDGSGRAVAVTQFGSDHKEWEHLMWAVPIEKLEALRKDSKFQFDYGKVTEASLHPFMTGVGDAITLGAAVFPRVGGPILAALSAYDLYTIASGDAPPVKDSNDKIYRGLQWTSDLAAIGGAVMSYIPAVRVIGWAALGVGALANIAEDYVPHETGIISMKRKDGSTRPPLFWDG